MEEEQVRATLSALLEWDELQRSPQLAKFLRYVVEQKLAGNEQNVKAYAIAVDVFGRPADFDPQSDPIVRVQARRLRGLLDRFYARPETDAAMRICLPVGRYVPEFEPFERTCAAPDEIVADKLSADRVAVEGAEPIRSEPGQLKGREALPIRSSLDFRRWPKWAWAGVLLGALVLVLHIAALAGLERGWLGAALAPAVPGTPLVRVGSFTNRSGSPELDGFSTELRRTVAQYLGGYPDLAVAGPDTPASAAPTLSGVLQKQGDKVEVIAQLTGGPAGPWTTTAEIPAPGEDWAESVAAAAKLVVGRLGTYRGPLHAAGRAWILENRRLEEHPTTYTCLLRFRAAGEQEQAAADGDLFSCLDRLLAADPDNAAALAARAWLDLPHVRSAAAGDDENVDAVMATADKAVALAPQSSFVHAFRARVLDATGQHKEALAEFIAALALSPADLDARASYAEALTETDDWARGAAEAAAVLDAAPQPPPWYYCVPMLDAYRRADWNSAVDDALSYAIADREVGAGIAVAAAAHAGRTNVIQRYLPAVLSGAHFRKTGILPSIATRVSDAGLLSAIGDGLVLAGVPRADLMQPF